MREKGDFKSVRSPTSGLACLLTCSQCAAAISRFHHDQPAWLKKKSSFQAPLSWEAIKGLFARVCVAAARAWSTPTPYKTRRERRWWGGGEGGGGFTEAWVT